MTAQEQLEELYKKEPSLEEKIKQSELDKQGKTTGQGQPAEQGFTPYEQAGANVDKNKVKVEKDNVADTKIATLNGAQSQNTQTTANSKGETTSQTTYNPVLYQKQKEKILDPLRKDIADKGAVRAFLDGIENGSIQRPDGKRAEDAARAERVQKKAAMISESLRLLTDIGFGHAGGDVYQRNATDFTKAEQKTAAARDAYQKALDDFKNKYLDAAKEDRTRDNALVDKILEASKQQKTNTQQSQQTQSETDQKSATQQVVQKPAQSKTVINNGGSKDDGSKEWRYTTINGNSRNENFVKMPKAREEAAIKGICEELAKHDKKVVEKLAAKYHTDPQTMKRVLLSGDKFKDEDGIYIDQNTIAQNEWMRTQESANIFFKATDMTPVDIKTFVVEDQNGGIKQGYTEKKQEQPTPPIVEGGSDWFN